MKLTYTAASGHTLRLVEVKQPDFITCGYNHVYEVRNWDVEGVPFFYLCTGYEGFKFKEVHVWYMNGQMWHSFATNIQNAIDGAQRDGWLYTRPKKEK